MIEAAAERALLELYPRLLESLRAGAGGPFAAGVLVDGRLVGTGTNTVMRDHDVTRHAEMNALTSAGRALGRVHLADAVLVTTHLPCLMCWHAAKWARITEVFYVFDYDETESIFGFRGDAGFLSDLGITGEAVSADPRVRLHRVRTPEVDARYRQELPVLWNATYRERLGAYDAPPST